MKYMHQVTIFTEQQQQPGKQRELKSIKSDGVKDTHVKGVVAVQCQYKLQSVVCGWRQDGCV